MAHVVRNLEEALGGLNEHERKNAPREVYIAGDLDILTMPRVSVVGARKASEDALKRARKLCRQLVSERVAIVSGLALGVDHAAHTTAIEQGGRTIAVLGTPLDEFFPREHERLQREIMERHLALSQFAPGTPVGKGNFPMRNRTMALISNATVIVEASDTSGTLHQGWEAVRLGRPVFIMQSVVDKTDLKWPREMIGYGARVLSDVSEVLAVLPPTVTDRHGIAAAL